ncbi:MAG TPA: hypothetical protein VF179_30485 [Thermoanaerobaculia bacterium]|nr:hypothetical protein [Thermoanaerobaculia bacterium]
MKTSNKLAILSILFIFLAASDTFAADENRAATSSCDKAATLSSEELVARFGFPDVTEFSEACHSTTPCGPAYGSCANWSYYEPCGDTYCNNWVLGCGECGPFDPCVGPALFQPIERFRVCLNEQAEECTEYEYNFYQLGCGC